MCITATTLMKDFKEMGYEITHLVSGGAAWADHTAVNLFLNKKLPNLKIFIPCEFIGGSFADSGIQDSFKNPGGTLNYYHRSFQQKTGINSLTEIQIAKSNGAQLIPTKGGFYGRNAMVAKSDFLLAMTFGNKQIVKGNIKKGGTANTVASYLNRVKKEGFFDKSYHYDLNCGEVFPGCIVLPEEKQTRYSRF